MKQKQGKGEIPQDKCPECGKSADYEYGDIDNGQGRFISQEITCNNCDTEFSESLEVKSWSKSE